MKNIFTVLIVLAAFSSQSFAQSSSEFESLKKRLAEMESRMAEVEIKSEMNTFKWSGVLINRFEDLQNKTGAAENHVAAYSTILNLNVSAALSEKVSFYGTLGMSKFWNNDGRSESTSYWSRSMTGSYAYNGSTPMVDRAYFTYKFDMPLSFAIGRMSTNMGPPIEQLDGLARQGTYPRFAYNAIFDGMALSYDFAKVMPTDHSLRTTLFFTPFVSVSPDKRTEQITSGGNKVDSNNQQYTFLAEYELQNLAVAKKLALTYFFYDYRNFFWQDDTGDLGYYTGTANALYFGLEEIAGTGLNVSASYLNVGSHTEAPKGALTTSQAYLANINYRFGSLGNLVLGGEYIDTDKGFYLDEWTYSNLIPFYQTGNSTGTHFYVSKSLGNSLTGRVGYYKLDSKSGATTEVDMTSYYANLRLDF